MCDQCGLLESRARKGFRAIWPLLAGCACDDRQRFHDIGQTLRDLGRMLPDVGEWLPDVVELLPDVER